MNFILKVLFVFSCIAISNLIVGAVSMIPHFDEEWWGPVHKKLLNDTSIRPFHIEFDQMMISDLKYRLKKHRPFTPPLEGVGFDYGFNTDYLHGWVDYWANNYDFKYQEKVLNHLPQYKTNIQGLDIHFVWVKPHVPPNVKVVPLLLLHGFPGSVVEFYKTIPLLTSLSKDRDFAVEVIAPSLPGFGFSDAAIRPGLGASEMGVVLRNLMHRLGFKKFYVQGGDWGAYVGFSIATIYPEETLGYHTNLAVSLAAKSLLIWVLGSVYPPLVMDKAVIDRAYPILNYLEVLITESGYFHIQAAKPDTIGVAMADSPSGLLAYVLQLFSSGSRRKFVQRADGGLDDLYTRDELLNNIMLYWVPNSFTTASRIYAETANKKNLFRGIYAIPTPVPTWTIHAKDEIIYQSPLMLKVKYPNLLHSTILPGAGHFLALEEPEIFADDVLKAIAAFRRWHRKH